MFSEFNALNRSHSESDIYISQFDNLAVSSPSKNLTKSFHNSCSSIVRRVYIEEVFSCNGKQIGNMFIKYNKIDNARYAPSSRRREQNYLIEDDEGIEEVPMEVDSSFPEEPVSKIIDTDELNSLPRLRKVNNVELDEKPDCDSVQNKQLPEQTLKPRIIHINPVKRKHNWNVPIIVCIIICILYVLSFTNIIIVNNEIQLDNIKNDLELNIHGHSHLVKRFVDILDRRANWGNKLQLISFVGSQGVGKTFFAELVKSHFPSHMSHDIYGTNLLYASQRQKVLDSINNYCLNLIVVDDLKLSDTLELFAFAHSLPKDSFILLIAIFNIHYTDDTLNTIVNRSDIMKIRDNFKDSGIKNYEFFVFEDFTDGQIKEWIKKTLDSKSISSSVRDKILQSILNSHDIKRGLKGLQSKILLELEKHRT